MPEVSPPLLEVENLVKRFSGVTALDQVTVSFLPGEVHAVIGENGAGKSTLMRILAGVESPDEGRIMLDGQPVSIGSVQDAMERGIALIHQELNLADNLDVGANIFLGREPRRGGCFIDFAAIRRQSSDVLEQVGLPISPGTLVSSLTMGPQQLVEIAKALSTDARVLIMDEPTSSLTQHDAERLFEVIERLRDRGVCVIYISHRLGEIQRIADRVTVLRDGCVAGHLERDEIDHDSMVALMVGRELEQFYSRGDRTLGEPALTVRGLRTPAWPQHAIDLQVASGEMVGIAGLVGAGRTELLECIFGIVPPLGGEIVVGRSKSGIRSCADAIAAGIAMVPEDRKQQGLILEAAIRSNISLAGLKRNQRLGGFVNFFREREDSAAMIPQLRIKSTSDRQSVQFLSGGNQQKVVIGKWLSMTPSVLLLDEPTRGVDIGAKQEIYRLMEQLTDQGVAILFVSSEMEEVISMSDRTLVMHQGKVMGELGREQLSEESVMRLATGRRMADHDDLESASTE